MGLWRPLLVASANSRSGRLDGCGQLPTHSAQPPALGACRWGGDSSRWGHRCPPSQPSGTQTPAEAQPRLGPGGLFLQLGGLVPGGGPSAPAAPRAPGPEVQGPPSGIPAAPMLLRFVRARRTVMANIYCRGKQPHGPARGPARRCQGAGRPGCCPDGSPGGQASGPRPRSPRRTHSGPAQHVGREDAVPCPSRSRPPHEGPGHTGLGSSSHPPLPSAGAGTWVPTQGWTRSHGHIEPSPRADRV